MFFHGGGFGRGDKNGLEPRFRDLLLKRGFAVASANYRLRPEARFPAPMQDGARAVQHLKAHAETYGLDKNKFATAGRSAGGAIALWIAYHDDIANLDDPDPVNRESSRVRATAVINAQTTFRPKDLQRLFGADRVPGFFANLLGKPLVSDEAAKASPIVSYTRDDPPSYFLYITRGNGGKVDPSRPNTFIHNRNFADPVRELATQYGLPVTVKEARPGELAPEYIEMCDFLAKTVL